MTAYIEPVNTKLIQQNMRKDAQIARLERENALKNEALQKMHAERIAYYAKRSRRNRLADENLGYILIAALAVGALWAFVWIGEMIVWKVIGLC